MRVTLDEVCTKATSKYAQKDLADMTGDYPVFGASGFIKNIGVYQQEKTYVAVVKDGAGIGRTMLLPGKSSVIGTMQYLLPKENIIPKFLYYAVKSMHLEKYYTGATIPHIYFKDYKKETFDLPKDIRQKEIINILEKEIINILDKVELIIQSRKLQLNALDELIKSRFVEMFGDPLSNSKGWPIATIKEVCKAIIGGGTPSKSHPEYFTGTIPWISPKDMKTGIILDSTDHITEEAVANSTTKLIPPNSVLMVIRSGILKHTLPVAINSIPVTINQDMKAFVPDDKVTTSFLMQLFKAIECDILATVRGVTADNIDFRDFQNRSIIVPSIALQEQFALFVKQTNKSRLLFKCQLLQYHSIEHIIRGRNYG